MGYQMIRLQTVAGFFEIKTVELREKGTIWRLSLPVTNQTVFCKRKVLNENLKNAARYTSIWC